MTDNSVQVDPNAVILVRSSNQSGEELPIGTNVIRVTATDEAGNTDSCSFNIVVRGNYYTHEKLCSLYLPSSSGTVRLTFTRQFTLFVYVLSCPYLISEQNLLFSIYLIHLYSVSVLRKKSINNTFQLSKISTRLYLCKHAKFANFDTENVVPCKPNYSMPS